MPNEPILLGRARQDIEARSSEIHFTRTGVRILCNKDGHPIAVRMLGMIYFSCTPGPERKSVNKWTPEGFPQVLASPDQFDFLLGQALQQAGLRLSSAYDIPSRTSGAHPAV